MTTDEYFNDDVAPDPETLGTEEQRRGRGGYHVAQAMNDLYAAEVAYNSLMGDQARVTVPVRKALAAAITALEAVERAVNESYDG